MPCNSKSNELLQADTNRHVHVGLCVWRPVANGIPRFQSVISHHRCDFCLSIGGSTDAITHGSVDRGSTICRTSGSHGSCRVDRRSSGRIVWSILFRRLLGVPQEPQVPSPAVAAAVMWIILCGSAL